MIYRTPIAVALVFAFAMVNFSQRIEITEKVFWDTVYQSRKMADKYNHRVTRIVEKLEGEKFLQTNEWINELVLPDKKRWITTSRDGKIASKTEQIEIGNIKYCRKDGGSWLVKDCTNMTLSGGGQDLTKTFNAEDIVFEGQTTKHIVYRRTFDYGSGLRFDQFECWIDKTGRILRELSTSGEEKTNKLLSRNLATYEYNPKDLKIEAPIN